VAVDVPLRIIRPAAGLSIRGGAAARGIDSRRRVPDTLRMRAPRTVVAGHDVNAYLARHVPITRAMGIRLRSFDAGGVTMTAPLAPNVNDKGIAFGGSLASILARR